MPQAKKFMVNWYTGIDYKAIPGLLECCKQVEAEGVSNGSNKIHQTWERPLPVHLDTQLCLCVDNLTVS